MFTFTSTVRGTTADPPETLVVDGQIIGMESAVDNAPLNTREHQLLDGSNRVQIVGRTARKLRLRGSLPANTTLIGSTATLYDPMAEWVKFRRMQGQWVDVQEGGRPYGVGLITDISTTFSRRIGGNTIHRAWTADILMRDSGWEAHIVSYTGTPVDNPYSGVGRDGTPPTDGGDTTTPPPAPALRSGLVRYSNSAITALRLPSDWGTATTMAPSAATGAGFNTQLVAPIPAQIQATALYIAIAVPQSYANNGAINSVLTSDDSDADPLDTIVTSNFANQSIVFSLNNVRYNVHYTATAVSATDFGGRNLIVTLSTPPPMMMQEEEAPGA